MRFRLAGFFLGLIVASAVPVGAAAEEAGSCEKDLTARAAELALARVQVADTAEPRSGDWRFSVGATFPL